MLRKGLVVRHLFGVYASFIVSVTFAACDSWVELNYICVPLFLVVLMTY